MKIKNIQRAAARTLWHETFEPKKKEFASRYQKSPPELILVLPLLVVCVLVVGVCRNPCRVSVPIDLPQKIYIPRFSLFLREKTPPCTLAAEKVIWSIGRKLCIYFWLREALAKQSKHFFSTVCWVVAMSKDFQSSRPSWFFCVSFNFLLMSFFIVF